jgi:hypothetical protein
MSNAVHGLPPRLDHMETGVAIFPSYDAIAPAVERALDRYETAIAEFHGEL